MKPSLTRLILAQLFVLSGCTFAPGAPDPGATEPLQGVSAQNLNAPPPLNGLPGQDLRSNYVAPDENADPAIYEVTLTAGEGWIQLRPEPEPKTRMMVFNGQYPGPTLKATIGQRVKVNVKNTFPEAINVHFHGMVIEPEHDGGPWNTISPGQTHTYTWIAKDTYPMTGWYHAHSHGMTHIHTPRGLVGGLLIADPNEPIPPAYGDHMLILSDQKFTADNQLPPDTEFDRFNGREGDHVFVNGQEKPVFTMKTGEIHRFRVLDGGPARYYKIAAPGMDMWQIGTDGGLIERPVKQNSILLGVAERAEILLQAPMTPGTYKLQSLPYDRGLGLRESFTRDLMTIKVVAGTVDQPAIASLPNPLRTIAPINLAGARHRHFELGSESIGGCMKHYVINEKSFDPLRVDNVAKIGDTEIWTIDNKSGNWDHPMHLHSVQFQILDIDGQPPAFRAWKDVMNLPRSSRGRFAVRYNEDEFPGIFMFHCHILQHEDDGMMTHIMVDPKEAP